MDAAFKIGHDSQAVTEVGDLIRYIVDAPTGERVKLAALEAMKSTLSIGKTTLSNCHVIGSQDTTRNYYGEQDDAGEETDD